MDTPAAVPSNPPLKWSYGDFLIFSNGVFEVAFEMTVGAGASGYFNFGNSGDVTNWDWEKYRKLF